LNSSSHHIQANEGEKIRKTKSDNLLLIEQVIDLNVSIVLYIFLLRFGYLGYIFFVLLKDVYSRKKKQENNIFRKKLN
jgi:hypothetical protein